MNYPVNDQGEIIRGSTSTLFNGKNNSIIWLILLILIIGGGLIFKVSNDRSNEEQARIRTELQERANAERAEAERATENERVIKERLDQAAAIVSEARTLFDYQNYDEAIKKLNQALNLNSEYYNDDYFLWLRGANYHNNGNYNMAIIDFNSAIEINSGNKDIYYWRASSYDSLSLYNDAITDFTRAIELSEGSEKAKYHYLRGNCYLSLNILDLAEQDYYMAVRFDSENITYVNKLNEIREQTTTNTQTSNSSPNENYSARTYSNQSNSASNKNSSISVKVITRNAYIYSYPERRAKYKTRYKRSRETVLKTYPTKYGDFYIIDYYDEEKKVYTTGYIRSDEVLIYN